MYPTASLALSAGKKVSNPINIKGDGVRLMAIYFLTSAPVYNVDD
jgi:hypothetical protein